MIDDVLEEYRCDHDVILEPQLVMHDQLLAGLVQACAAAMRETEMPAQAYVDHLSWALAAHLVRICCKKQVSQNSISGKRSEEHTSELQSLMRISYAVFCLKKNTNPHTKYIHRSIQITDETVKTSKTH